MADGGGGGEGGGRGGFRGGFGDRGRGGRGDRGGRGGRGDRGRGRGRGRGGDDKEEWVPVTKLGRLVKDGKIKNLEQIYLHSLPIKEAEIIDTILGTPDRESSAPGQLRDEVLKIHPVQKQTKAGQRTRFKAFVAIGDHDGHLGLGTKCSKEVANAIRGAIQDAKLQIIPVRRGYWGSKLGQPHTIPCKLSAKCGSVLVRLIPAPRGSSIVGAPVPKKLLTMAGVSDCYTTATGQTATLGNFAKATFKCIMNTYTFLTPDMWDATIFTKTPAQEFTDMLARTDKK